MTSKLRKAKQKKNLAIQDMTIKVLTAVAAAFLKNRHGLFLSVEHKKYLIHNMDGTIMIDTADAYDNFQHGLHMKLTEVKEGEFEATKPDEPEKLTKVEIDL